MGECKDCKHWERTDIYATDKRGTLRMCLVSGEHTPRALAEGDSGTVIKGDAVMWAPIYTWDTFGCVLFEPKGDQ